jgi:hypothetical protein
VNDLNITVLLSIPLFGFLIWLLLRRERPTKLGGPSASFNADCSLLIAKHYGYFPQIRQALSAADSQFLRETAPPQIAKQALRERRGVAKGFLKGLREDFSNLARLGRIIAALSPSVSREQETERLVLYLKFHVLYTLVWLRLSSGNLPVHQLERLTELVERLATRMEEAMSNIGELSVGRLSGGLGG